MSLRGLDNEFLFALRTSGEKRTERELDVLYSRLQLFEPLANIREKNLRDLCLRVRYEFHEAEEMLFKKNDLCHSWYILLSGSVFIQGSMFLPHYSFGKQIPGTKLRGCQCLVLEPSEMLAIDYPDMAIHTTASNISTRPHALRRGSASASTDRISIDNVTDIYTSSSEGSPSRNSRSSSLPKTSNGQALLITDTESQSSYSKDLDDDDDDIEEVLGEDDSLSLHSSSSFLIKDLVIEVLKKDIENRNQDDIEMLMEFTKSLGAFTNMTESVRKSLCRAMVFAYVELAHTVVLKDNEELDSWSVIINGQVQVKNNAEERILFMGDTFGVEPNLKKQYHRGEMKTVTDDCQFLCIPQPVYCELVQHGKENIEAVCDEAGEVITVKEKREYDNGKKTGNIVIRGTADSLMQHMLEENAIDTTYTEDFLLTYRAFSNEPHRICKKLLEWFDNNIFRDKVVRILLLWVNNHFNDFERSWSMMKLLEEFEEKLNKQNLQGQTKLLNIACTTKAKPRVVTLTRSSRDDPLGLEIAGGVSHQGRHQPIYIESVVQGSVVEAKGVKKGDQLLDVNGRNFEKVSFKEAQEVLNKNTELSLTLKTNLFGYKEAVSETTHRKSKKGKHRSLKENRNSMGLSASTDDVFDIKMKKGNTGTIGRATRKLSRIFKKETNYEEYVTLHGGAASQMTSVDDSFLTIPSRTSVTGSSATLDLSSRSFRYSSYLSHSNPDLLEHMAAVDFLQLPVTEAPEDVIKIYKSDQNCKFMFVNEDTTAGDAVAKTFADFAIAEDIANYALYRITVQKETNSVKQSKLPDAWFKLANIPLGSRYYLKNTMNSEQLLPDENIPDLVKEANFSFLDLNCFEVALYLTREDYRLFQLTEPTNFIDDLFHRDTELQHFKDFEDLVNRELFWVVTTICNEPSAIQRSKIIKHFIKIAHHCKVLKNFNSTFALVSGLGYRAVSRLKQTWERVPTKSIRLFKELQALMDPSRNMSKYRTLLNDFVHQPPVIPYIPVVKKDLTFLHLGNDTKVNGLINFEKMRMIAKEVRNVCRLCAPDKSQIIPSAVVAQQKEPDKGAIYQTLVRRGRRASFNNVRRVYEDQMNVRRVRQYMEQEQMGIITDEEKLMDMSKQVEPLQAASSAQTKRRNTTAAASPSRSSKTLPNQPGRGSTSSPSSNLQSRNNSEPHLTNIPDIQVPQPTRKKTLSSTLPKYGNADQSPQMISRKLMSLSEEAVAEDKRVKGKKIKDAKRSASVSSQDTSPSSSPYITPKHQEASKLVGGNHTVASENVNKNNNRLSMPLASPSGDPSHSPMAVYGGNRKSHPLHLGNAASCRSSIASTSSLGTMSSSNPSTSSLVGNGGSPRSSSPISWGSSVSLPHGGTSRLPHGGSNSPSRSASGSSADTVKSAVELQPHHERPIIKQSRNSRSGSYGGANMIPSSMNERILSQMSTSSSTPSLSSTRSQSALVLPNLPRIPRTPSVDSGVLSAGSMSADSVRFNPADENELFGRPYPQQFPQTHNPVPIRSSAARTPENVSAVNRRSQHIRSVSVDQPSSSRATSRPQGARSEEEKKDQIEQTFLSGYRGYWDTPRPEHKVPINLPLSSSHSPADHGKLPPDLVLHPDHIPPGMKTTQTRHPGTRHVLGKGVVKDIHEFVVSERQAAKHRLGFYRNIINNDTSNPVMQPNFINTIRNTTNEDILEEQLVQELSNQKLTSHKTKRLLHFAVPESSINLANLKRLTLTHGDPSKFLVWPGGYGPPEARGQLPSPQSMYPSERVMMAQDQYHHSAPTHPHEYSPAAPPHLRTSPQVQRPTSLTNHTRSHRGLNSTEASAIAAYDALQYNNGWPQEGSEVAAQTHLRNGDRTMPDSLLTPDEHYYLETQKRLSGHYLPSPMATGPIERCFERAIMNDRDMYQQYQPSLHPMEPGSHPPPNMASHHVIRSTPEQVSHVRRKSQEWNETDLDGDKQQQAMKAWGSNASLSGTPMMTSQLPPRSLHPELLQKSSSETKSNKPPAPPPPLRTSSISRTPVKSSSGSNSPSCNTPPPAPATNADSVRTALPQHHNDTAIKANGFLPNGQPSTFTSPISSNSNHERRSLPTYNEALHQINTKQHAFSIYSSPINNSYRNFNTEKRENKEQISQV